MSIGGPAAPTGAPETREHGSAAPVRPRILLVDDDPLSARSLKRALCRIQCDVEWARDEASARERLLNGETFHGYVLDVCLTADASDVGGVRLAALVRRDDPRVPVLVISGVAEIALTRDVHGLGCDFCAKPVERANFDEFVSDVRRLCDVRQACAEFLEAAIDVRERQQRRRLSPAERGLLRGLLRGSGQVAFARGTGRSVHTARKQTVRVRAKLGYESTPAMVAGLWSIAFDLRAGAAEGLRG